MIKKTFLLIFTCLIFASNANAEAIQSNVAVVDVQTLLSKSDVAISIFEQVQEKRKKLTFEFSALEQKLKKKKDELIEKRKDLTKEDFDKRGLEFEKEVFQTRKLAQQKRGEIDQALAKAREQVYNKITSIVGKVSKDNGFQIVITSNNVIVFEKSVDLTEEVMTKLNADLKTINLDLEGKE